MARRLLFLACLASLDAASGTLDDGTMLLQAVSDWQMGMLGASQQKQQKATSWLQPMNTFNRSLATQQRQQQKAASWLQPMSMFNMSLATQQRQQQKAASWLQPMNMFNRSWGAQQQQQKAASWLQPMNMFNKSWGAQQQQQQQQKAGLGLGLRPMRAKKVVQKGSFIAEDRQVCWETPLTRVGWTISALRQSPLSYFAHGAKALNGTCEEQGFKLLLMKLDPCFKGTSMWKYDLDPEKKGMFRPQHEYRSIQAYNKDVDQKRYNVHKHCFGPNGVVEGMFKMNPVAALLNTITPV